LLGNTKIPGDADSGREGILFGDEVEVDLVLTNVNTEIPVCYLGIVSHVSSWHGL
jgi:hypothetical protein